MQFKFVIQETKKYRTIKSFIFVPIIFPVRVTFLGSIKGTFF